MKKLSKKTIILPIASVVIILAVIMYFIAPGYLYNKTINGLRKDAGLTMKSQSITDFTIVYLEGGTGDTIIMLHGFGGNKDNWLRLAKHFTPNYRVIIPDLPGFGETSKPANATYTIASQVERLNLLVRELKIKEFHLMGNSMGGCIAGTYAATYPERVKTLALLDSGGVRSPVKSELELLLEKGTNPFVIKNVADFDNLLALNFYKPIKIPSIVKKYLATEAAKDAKLNAKISSEIAGTDFYKLEEKLHMIKAPTLIVWGDSDKILDISALPVFEKNIKNAKSLIIKECGHLPMLEKPAETAAAYKNFLKGEN
jgi:abhydrolase domain-containing protein 6